MGLRSKAQADHQARLTAKWTFESFLRYGRVPDIEAKVAADPLSAASLGDTRPSRYYTWRTARDSHVRAAHAANEGKVFSWDDPPATGSPGKAQHCRCWAEPYYGTPGVPDSVLSLRREQFAASGREPWTHIETATRPDGSLAASSTVLRDGTRIASTFAGSAITHHVHLPTGQAIRVEKRNGIQAFYRGESDTPMLRTFWGPNGPLDVLPGNNPGAGFDRIKVREITPLSTPSPGDIIGLAVFFALLALYNATVAKPEAVGESAARKPLLAMRAWALENNPSVQPLSQTTLDLDQAGEFCKRLPDVQTWTNEAASVFKLAQPLLRPQDFGNKVHAWIKHKVDGLKSTGAYEDIRAEFSFIEDAEVYYSKRGSTRLDIYEDRRKESGYVCVYDVKTGDAVLTPKRLLEIGAAVIRYFGPARFIILEVKPMA